ncbi:conserved hypothetical protein [Histoplasma capsulatum G186AR]|uniref:S-adenosyl-L-methionine-dependent methyltransferase n=1 Tax=Ajellomyces capsulatus (strain G186AR / H82 / ATCC MYA-2454 / RMSCC 2432) TaxID=447093 RepID=C0NDS4_AJECG|nr:uncharacterized protein HCBG_02017 [Histoplasma capsulatum G186AR]EEH10372.1 conserved hypothetical protein [Histoplasma capsulatum G186AR]
MRSEAFSRFWINFTNVRDGAEGPPVGSSALIPPLLATADGLVLDVGPGTGTQTPFFTNANLVRMYGAEPCQGLHKELMAKVEACGLSDKYQILPCSVERKELYPALEREGLLAETEAAVVKGGVGPVQGGRGVFDTIVCVRVLCSVPDQRGTVRGLYDLLKPGGKLVVCEHVRNRWGVCCGKGKGKGKRGGREGGSFAAWLVQMVLTMLGWEFFMGNCHMNRDTERVLREVAEEAGDGGWEKVDVQRWFEWSALPYVAGTLVKRREG